MKAFFIAFNDLKGKYWPLIKSLQTSLLWATGLAGYMSARCPVTTWPALLGLAVTLFLAISGSTVLNMWYDRDIDALMHRTAGRPLPSGRVRPIEALFLGCLLSLLGVGGALLLSPLYGLVVFCGLFFDVVVYTMWLKRRTAWSIIVGGISGGMPILAGRVLGEGRVDWIGVLLVLAVLFWIPTHIMTFSMRFYSDYCNAAVPTFPSTYGFQTTRAIITASSLLAALSIGLAAYNIGMTWSYLRVLIVLSSGLMMLSVRSMIYPSDKIHFGLFKYASIYMICAMLLVMVQSIY